jgi:hypothetical protein
VLFLCWERSPRSWVQLAWRSPSRYELVTASLGADLCTASQIRHCTVLNNYGIPTWSLGKTNTKQKIKYTHSAKISASSTQFDADLCEWSHWRKRYVGSVTFMWVRCLAHVWLGVDVITEDSPTCLRWAARNGRSCAK